MVKKEIPSLFLWFEVGFSKTFQKNFFHKILLAEDILQEQINFKENLYFHSKDHHHFFPSTVRARTCFSVCHQHELFLKLCHAIPNKCWTEYKDTVYQKWRHNSWVAITGGKFLLCFLAQKSVRIMGKITMSWFWLG